MADLSLCHLKCVTILSLKSKPTSQLQPLTPLSYLGLHCSTELPSEEGPANFTQNHTHTAAPCRQKQLLREMSKPCFDNFKQVLAESWIIHVNNPWLNHGWSWSHRSTLHQPKHFLRCFVCCGGAVEIGETEFASQRFLRVRWSSV